ncbi:hypothetical protein BDV95DRAFT_340889 [Massariosphaeria phaeospora]|uniref:Uncharacterized protein n=1 Tax=Massariosphaeria phaeospora TaxID=100035 RepID=A0A7C8MB32_9PLEO|nr:hypothetical protein BDV95DRAFT_340889 [Massariosphaeria phaeospora]
MRNDQQPWRTAATLSRWQGASLARGSSLGVAARGTRRARPHSYWRVPWMVPWTETGGSRAMGWLARWRTHSEVGGGRQSRGRTFPEGPGRGAAGPQDGMVFVGTKRYLSSRHRYGAAALRGPHIGSGWHRSTNIMFDCGPNLRRTFWGTSVQVGGTDDPAAAGLCSTWKRCGAPGGPGTCRGEC